MGIEYFISEFMKSGGIFGLLFGGAISIIFFLYRENKQLSKNYADLAEKRVSDLKEAQKINDSQSQASRTIAESNYRIAEQILSIVQSLQQLIISMKGSK